MKKLYFAVAALFCLNFATGNAQNTKDEWTIVETYEIPGKASGLASDGQYIYFGQYSSSGNEVYRFDPQTGTYEFVCYGPMEDAYGLTWDGSYLWSTDHPGAYDPGIAYQFDLSGSTVSQFECPATYMGGIAYDDGLFWLAAYYDPDGAIFLTDDQGTVLKQFATPGAQPWDICLQEGSLWIADYNDNMLYQVDTISGSLMESHQSEGSKPAGIVYDGEYLWYVDGPLNNPSTLYKVDLGGAGTPEITIPMTTWDYGNVTVGDTAVFNMNVINTGTATLEVTDIVYPGSAPVFCYLTFPVTIEPSEIVEIPLYFIPQEVGPLDVTAVVQSNDPITPEVEVTLTGEGVNSGPVIYLPETNHTYGYVRVDAYTRWLMEIENTGSDDLIISGIESDEPCFSIDEDVEFPLTLSTLETTEIGVWFSPPQAITYTGTLTIASNDQQNPVMEVTVGGTGLETNYPIGAQLWEYTINAGWDNSPKAIEPIADINGDGIDDVIVCSDDDYVRCFNGNSNETADLMWEVEIVSGKVYQQSELFIADDVDGDGFQEVVVGTTGADRSVRMMSGKTGATIWNFATSSQWGDGGWVYAVDASQDINDDGVNDVLACAGDDQYGNGPNRAFCLDGSNGNLLWSTPREGPGFNIIFIKDVNGDGYHDALLGASNDPETIGKVKCLDGRYGNVIWEKTVPGTSVWGLVQLDDVNGDNVWDVAVGDFQGNFFGLDAVNGNQLFSGSIGSYKMITKLVRLIDLNGDGYSDFTIGSSSSNCVVVNGYNGMNIWLTSLMDKCWNVDQIGDISGDGINDVIAGTLFSNNYVYFLNGVNGEVLESVSMGQPVDALSSIADITSDASMEVVAGDRSGKVVCLSGGMDAVISIDEPSNDRHFFTVGVAPNPFAANVTITIATTKPVRCSAGIYSMGGRLIRSFGEITLTADAVQLSWDGKGQAGSVVPGGLYLLLISDGTHSKAIRIIKQ